MYKLLKAAWYKLYVFMRRRDQFESVALREFFRQRYDIDVGMYSYGCFDRWRMPGPMSIGRYCSFASTVRVVPESHPLDAISTHPALYDRSFGVLTEATKRPLRLTVGDDVWVGHNAVILPGCKNIGRGAVIGAGSIVTRDVAPYTIIAGNPARTLRERFDPGLIVAIEESEWWLLDMNKLADLTRTHPGMLSRPTVAQLTSWRALEAERSTADAEVPT